MSPLFSWVAKVGGAAPAVHPVSGNKVQPKSLQMLAFDFKANQPSLGRELSPAVLFSQGEGEALKVNSKGKLIQVMAWVKGLKMKLQFWPAVLPCCGSVEGESCN